MKSIKHSSLLRGVKIFIYKHFLLCLWVFSSLLMALMLLFVWWKYANDFVKSEIGSYAILAVIPTAIAIVRSGYQWWHRKSKRVLICTSDEKMSILASAIGVRLLQSCYSPHIDTIHPNSEYRRSKLVQGIMNNSYIIVLISPDYLSVVNHRDWVRQIIECAVSYKIDIIPVITQESDLTVGQSSYMGNLKFCHPINIDPDNITTTEMREVFNAAECIRDRLNKLDDKQYGYHYISSFLRYHFFQYLDPNAYKE